MLATPPTDTNAPCLESYVVGPRAAPSLTIGVSGAPVFVKKLPLTMSAAPRSLIQSANRLLAAGALRTANLNRRESMRASMMRSTSRPSAVAGSSATSNPGAISRQFIGPAVAVGGGSRIASAIDSDTQGRSGVAGIDRDPSNLMSGLTPENSV